MKIAAYSTPWSPKGELELPLQGLGVNKVSPSKSFLLT